MWALDNRTAYAAERNWIRDKNGVHHWLVAVKATFDVALDGRLKLADEQPPPLLEPEYRGEPGSSSLRLDSDLLAVKPGTTVAVFAEEMRLAVTWQSTLKVPARDAEYLDQTAIGEKPYLA